MISTLELRWTERVLSGAQTPRRFLDFVIDGEPIYPIMGDVITPLGWLDSDQNASALNRLLRKAPADFPDGRTSIYVCPECADQGCGAVTIVIERVGENIIWRDFGYENNYDDFVNLEDYRGLGPYTFEASKYSEVFSRVLSDYEAHTEKRRGILEEGPHVI